MSEIRDPETDQVLPTPNERESVQDRMIREIGLLRDALRTDPGSEKFDADLVDASDRAYAEVQVDLTERRALGVRKYGTPLQTFNGRSFLKDSYEETLDLACYLRGLLLEEEEILTTTGLARISAGDFDALTDSFGEVLVLLGLLRELLTKEEQG